MPHPNGGRGTGSASHYHCRQKHLRSCANSNKFELIACRCHHYVLANHPLNLHSSHAWHKGVPSFNPGGRKDSVNTAYGGPTNSKFSSVATSAIPEKAEHMQNTRKWCKCYEHHLLGMVVCQIKE